MFATITELRVPELFHSLRIQDLSFQVSLGCLPDERAVPQEVRVHVEFRFFQAPTAVHSDALAETLCYADLSEALKDVCTGREFKLIEKLALDFHKRIQTFLETSSIPEASRILFAVTVHKVAPPVPEIKGGTFYRIGHFA